MVNILIAQHYICAPYDDSINLLYYIFIIGFIVYTCPNYNILYIVFALLAINLIILKYYLLNYNTNTPPLFKSLNYKQLDYTHLDSIASLTNDNNIIVKFTAEWCITCKLNNMSYNYITNNKHSFTNKKPVYIITLDITNKNPIIEEFMKEHQVSSIPCTIIFNKNNPKGKKLNMVINTYGLLSNLV
ncbi:MAG: thioredoxin domain-containing protein [Pseudomonadota bacterium]